MKEKTVEKVLAYVKKNPNATLREIGNKLGVTHQSVDHHIKNLILRGVIAPSPQKKWDIK